MGATKTVVDLGGTECFILEIEDGGGSCSSTLHYSDDNYKEAFDNKGEWERYEAMIDALESLVLSHACAGIDVTSAQYKEGLRTTLDGMANARL